MDRGMTYERGFNDITGDGYAIDVFNFDEETSKLFLQPNKAFFNFPYGSDHEVYQMNWTKTPVDSSDQEAVNAALPYGKPAQIIPTKKDKDGNPLTTEVNFDPPHIIGSTENILHEILREDGHYYAYNRYHLRPKIHITDVTFYIFSPKYGKLIAFYRNM